MTRQLAIVFAGTPEFAIPPFEALQKGPHRVVAAYTQPDRPAGRGQRLTESPVKSAAIAAGIPVEQPTTLRDPAAVQRLGEYAPDLIVVVAYGSLLPASVLAVPRLCCVNIHASLLPRWRGAAPIQRAIEAGDAETGVCIMQMDEGLDTGPVFARVATPIGPRETAGSLHDRLAELGAAALVETVKRLAAGDAPAEPQPAAGITYAHKIRKEEALLDFGRSALELDRLIRAFNPWPVAETRFRGSQLRIFAAEPVETDASGPPGQVLASDERGLLVATGCGVLALRSVQLAGRRRVGALDFAHAARPVGVVLGT
ncbi:MAG TPA: methionyl-tRNA formyltransferase [Steroidobacteraceae bacterium]|nr:methionyl-tRNA formyltransferase [Steroidobacteraceae bacterium]